jgi:hypothetical protein
LGAGVGALPYFFPLPPELFLASFLLIPPFLHRVCLFDLPLLRLLSRRFESWYLLWNSLMGIVCALYIYTHPYATLYAVLLWITSTPIVLADAIALSPYLTLASQVRTAPTISVTSEQARKHTSTHYPLPPMST